MTKYLQFLLGHSLMKIVAPLHKDLEETNSKAYCDKLGDNLLENHDLETMMAEKRHEHSGMSSKGFLDAEMVLKYIGIKEGDRFLDLGCGDGHFSIAASRGCWEGWLGLCF